MSDFVSLCLVFPRAPCVSMPIFGFPVPVLLISSVSPSRVFGICSRCVSLVPFQAVTRHHGDYSVMGTPSLQPFLKTYWLTPVNDWPIVAKHANMTSSRGSINAAPTTIRRNLFLHLAEPRLWLKMLQLTVKVRSFEGRPHGCSSAAFR